MSKKSKQVQNKKNYNSFNCSDQATITWFQRAKICAELLTPILGSSSLPMFIADIGCGDQKLKAILQELNIKLVYQGFDILPQANEVITLDIIHNNLPRHFNIAIMLGVIEYLDNLNDIFWRLASSVDYLAVSHVIQQDDTYSSDRLKELGWVNHLSKSELEVLLGKSKFNILSSQLTPDGRSLILLCKSEVIIETIEGYL